MITLYPFTPFQDAWADNPPKGQTSQNDEKSKKREEYLNRKTAEIQARKAKKSRGPYSQPMDVDSSSDESYDETLDGFIVPDEYLSDSEGDEAFEPKKKRIKLGRVVSGPHKLEEYTNLSTQLKENGSFNIVGRDETVSLITRLIIDPEGGLRPLLVGPVNVGKKAVVKKTVERLHKLQQRLGSEERTVIDVDCQAIMSNWISSLSNDDIPIKLDMKLKKILITHKNPILFFRNVDSFCRQDNAWVYLKTFFRTYNHIIASISTNTGEDNLQKCISAVEACRFKVVNVKECSKVDAKEVVKQQLQMYPLERQEISLPDASLGVAIDLADRYIKEQPFPRKAIQLIRETASNLKLMDSSDESETNCKEIKPEDLAKIVSEQTGIPPKELLATSWGRLKSLEAHLKATIVGQEKAIEKVLKRVKAFRMNLRVSDRRPAAVFLFVGPTGVGKTMLAEQLAQGLFNSKNNLIVVNMETFDGVNSVTRLTGADPGYKGYGESGALDGLIKQPQSVVLLDEIEKASKGVLNLLLGVFEQGILQKSDGNVVSFRDAIIICTSNVGADKLLELYNHNKSKKSKKRTIDEETVRETVRDQLSEAFSSEFRNRVEVIYFKGLEESDIPNVIEVRLKEIQEAYKANPGLNLTWTNEVLNYLKKIQYEPNEGMRKFCTKASEEVENAITIACERKDCALEGTVELDVINGTLVAREVKQSRKRKRK